MRPHRSGRSRHRRSRALAATLVAAAVVTGLTACEPPVPDGRDLGVTVAGAPAWLPPGASGSFDATVYNHGTASATSPAVSVFAPSHLSATASSADGTCAIKLTTADHVLWTCTLGPLAPGARGTVTVSFTGNGSAPLADVTVTTASDGVEPATDPHPNRVDVPIAVAAAPQTPLLEFGAAGPIAVGAELDVSGTLVLPEGFPRAPFQYLEASLPPGFELVSVVAGGVQYQCSDPAGGYCHLPAYTPGSARDPLTLRFRATAPSGPVTATVILAVEFFARASGTLVLEAIDPAVGAAPAP